MSGRTAKKSGPTGGFGVRYGVKTRRRYSEIMTEKTRKHVCPQCNSNSVTRVSVGIWVCSKCGLKFTGGAYTPTTKVGETSERAARTS